MTHFKNNKKGLHRTNYSIRIEFIYQYFDPFGFKNEKIKKNKNHTPKIILNPNQLSYKTNFTL